MNDVEGVIRIGQVSSIDENTGMARVLFLDRGSLVSYDYPLSYALTLNDKFYHMPAVKEWVICALLPNAPSQGFIIGSYYSEVREPPVKDKNKFHILFEDGTVLEYDKKLHRLLVDIPNVGDASIEVNTATDIKVNTKGKATVEAAKEIRILTDTNITIEAQGDVYITSVGNAEVNIGGNANLNIAGTTVAQCNGETTIECAEDMKIESKKNLTLKGKNSSMTL